MFRCNVYKIGWKAIKRVQGASTGYVEYRVLGPEYRVKGTGYWVQGTEY